MALSKKILKTSLIQVARLMPMPFLMRLGGRSFYVVNYHSLANVDVDPYINRNIYRTEAEFERDLRYYRRNFAILSVTDLIEGVVRSKPLPKNALVITFDDGLRINYQYQLPLLRRYEVTATFFVCSAFVDNRDLHFGRKANLLRQRLEIADPSALNKVRTYLSDNGIFVGDVDASLAGIGYQHRAHLDEIAKLIGVDFGAYLSEYKPYLSSAEIRSMIADGFTIGAHSVDHPRYSELPLEDQISQTIESVKAVVAQFDLRYRVFAFPYGTDHLGPEFFDAISPHVDLTFGMGGFTNDKFKINIHRADIESTKLACKLAFKYRIMLGMADGIRP